MPRAPLSHDAILSMRELREKDPALWTVRELAALFDRPEQAIRDALDPERKARRTQQKNAHRRNDPLRSKKANRDTKAASASKRAAGLRGVSGLSGAEVRERQKLIPADTRTFTQRFCGDPLPGRSALDRRTSAHGLPAGAAALDQRYGRGGS